MTDLQWCWIAECLAYLRVRNVSVTGAPLAGKDDWVAHVNDVAERPLYRRAEGYDGIRLAAAPAAVREPALRAR